MALDRSRVDLNGAPIVGHGATGQVTGGHAPFGEPLGTQPNPARNGSVGHGGHDVAGAHDSLLYGDLSKVYDLIFARVFYPRIARVIRGLRLPAGSRVLEIGVGTGLSLSAYPRHCHVVGLDRSADMLKHAQRKIERLRGKHIELIEGDALALPFPAESFDFVMVFHVITVVPDHARLLDEARRVLRPGGTVVVINHFRSASRWLSDIEKRLEPVSKRWGWTTLDVSEATAHLGDPRLHARGPRRGSLFSVLVARPDSPPQVAASGAPAIPGCERRP